MPASRATPTGRETVLVALGQAAVMLFGGLLALLIAQLFGKTVETDAFFAAYGLYSLGITFTQSFRLTAVSPLVARDDTETVTRMLGAVVALALVLAVPMVAFAEGLGGLLVDADPTDVAPDSLRILWIALVGQLLAAMLATVLAVRGAFKAIGVTTLLVGLISLGTFAISEPGLGILAAPVGLATGGVWLVAVLGAVVVRGGWRPRLPTPAAIRAMCAEAGRLAFASLFFLGVSLTYVIGIAMAARQGPGEATLFAYAYVLAVILVGITANVSGMVRSPAVVASAERTADAAEVGLWSFRFTVVLSGPVLAMAFLVGKPVIGFVLGSDFAGSSATTILVTLACLVGWVLGTAGGLFAVIELLARGELRRLALLAGVQVALVAALALAGAELVGIEGIAVAVSVVTLGGTWVQLRWAFGREGPAVAAEMARITGRQLAALGLAVAPSAGLVLAFGESAVVMVGAALLALALLVTATALAWPRESRALRRLLLPF
jgi:O-antigen/teichoic acid export membrane protein